VLDPGSRCASTTRACCDCATTAARAADTARDAADPVRLEVFGNRCMSIAEQMGAVLRNTSVSTNIKERLDYSCAVFDARAGSSPTRRTSRCTSARWPRRSRWCAAASPICAEATRSSPTIPFAGGSHLPDVTVVTPVFAGGARPSFFVASRGHHADIGGTSPGSIPADSRTLEEEGVLIEPCSARARGALRRGARARAAHWRALPRAPARRQRRGARSR
jgi:5-oxoprolinase (ATP-hydrolysing)